MINIVTGKINSGKTTKILEIYNQLKLGDGFVSVKNMDNDKVHSYDLLRLSTYEKIKFVFRKEYMPKDFKSSSVVGPYFFSKRAIEYVYEVLNYAIINNISPLFLDEIGLLELNNECFHDIFRFMLRSKLDIYFTVNDKNFDDVIKKYKITEYNVITV